VTSHPIVNFYGVSPDGRTIIVSAAAATAEAGAETLAVPVYGGSTMTICTGMSGMCSVAWSPDGRWIFLTAGVPTESPQSTAVPVPPGRTFPQVPAGGDDAFASWRNLPGARTIEQSNIAMGLDPSTYVFVKTAELRNLFRVPVK
jgi:hypothetical protein